MRRFFLSFPLLALTADATAQFTAPIQLEAYLKASNSGVAHQFGKACSVDGDTLVVGASTESGAASIVNGDQSVQTLTHSGAAYVFVQDGTGWLQEAYVKASNSGANDIFGSAVALDGDTLVVAAPAESSGTPGIDSNASDDSAMRAGAVYVFERTSTTWTQTTYIKPSVIEAEDLFGWSVSLCGDTLAVSAFGESGVVGDPTSNALVQSGAVWIFERSGTTWTETQYLKGSLASEYGQFGASLHLDGDRLFVGAPWHEPPGSSVRSGVVYHFERVAGSFQEADILVPETFDAGDNFGWMIDGHGSRLLVASLHEAGGAPGVDGDELDNSEAGAGAAYVFRESAGGWQQEAYLKHPDPDTFDRANDVALGEDVAVVGFFLDDSGADGVGADPFDNSVSDSGSAVVYTRTSAGWLLSEFLKHPASDVSDRMGSAVDIDDARLVVSCLFEASSATGIDGDFTDNSAPSAGCVLVYSASPIASARRTTRTAGTNPQSYTATLPVLGSNWTGTVDLALTGHTVALVAGFFGSTNIPLGSGNVLLVGPNFPNGEVMRFGAEFGPLATFDALIPNDLNLAGLPVYTQALHLGGVQPFALSNAIDLVLGI